MPEPNQKKNSTIHLGTIIALICFFLSGFTSLVCEICWIRKASLVFGATTLAVSTVVALFFIGLALGSFLFGKYTLKTNTPLRTYAVLEIALGVLLLFNPLLFRAGEYLFGLGYPALYDRSVMLTLVRIGILSLVLLPPAILMGGTLPLFCRQFTRKKENIMLSVGMLYGINTFGAATGCIVCGFFLIPYLGIYKSILLCGMVSVSIGLLLFILYHRLYNPATEGSAKDSIQEDSFKLFGSGRSILIAMVFLLSGFVALGNEIIWTRFLSLVIHNTVYTYTLTLGTILFGIVLGSFVVSLSARLINHYAFLFGIISILTGITVLGTLLMPVGFWGGVRDTQDLLTQTGIVIIILLIPSFMSGMAFPLAIRMLVNRPELAGAGVGTMTAFNTAGGVLGSLVAGFILLPFLGLHTSVFITTGVSVIVGSFVILFLEKRVKSYINAGIVLCAVMLWMFLPAVMDTRLPADYLAAKEKLVDFREGVSSHLAVVKNRYNIPALEIDRLWQGEERVSHQIMAAHIPMILHKDPQQVLVVGVGVGQTASRFLYYPVKQLDCVDIEKELFDLIRTHFNAVWLDDKRVSIIVEDGRNFISYTDKRYDIISIEIGQIFRPGCASFYTRDFYQAVKKRLNPEGLVCQFVPIVFLRQKEFLSVIRTFIEVFPHATLWYNRNEFLLIGSKDMQHVLTKKRLALLQNNAKVNRDLNYYYWGGPENHLNNKEVFSAGFLSGQDGLREMVAKADVYKDDRPLLEYRTAENNKPTVEDISRLLDVIRENCVRSQRIYADNIPDSIIKVIEHIRKYNLRNIIALSLYRSYIEIDKVDMLQKAYAMNPYNIDIAFDLGKYFAQIREYEKAGSCFRQTVTVHPGHADAHHNLGLMHLKRGRADSALYHLRETVEIKPEHAQAHNTIGVILAQQGSLEEALSHFTMAVEADSSYEKAQRNREKILKKSSEQNSLKDFNKR